MTKPQRNDRFDARAQDARRVSASEMVYRDLRARIVSLQLPPNTPLSRPDLAAGYGVSQTPVREALLQLQDEGLVDIYPQSRTVVSRIDVAGLSETHFLRAALEVETVRRLAAAGAADLTAAEAALARQREVAERGGPLADFLMLDRAFHAALFEAVGEPGLHTLIERRSGHLDRVRRLHLPSEGKMARILDGHAAILDAIRAGDADRAGDAMRDHLTETITSVDIMAAADPDYFVAA